MRAIVGLLGMLALLAASVGAWADDAEELIGKLDDAVGDLARTIGSMDEGDTRDIQGARGDIGDIGDILGDLVEFEDSVDGLERLISDYEQDLERADDALAALLGMAELAGQIEPMIERCEEIEREFTRFMQLVVQDEDAELDNVEEHAAAVGRVVQALLDDTEEIIGDMERLHDEASRPGLRHSDFRDVGGALEDAADVLMAIEDDNAEQLGETCELLADYRRHPGYVAAAAFFEDIDTAIDTFIDDAEGWLAEHAEIGPELCAFQTQIRNAYCALDMEMTEEDPRYADYERGVRSTQSAFIRVIDNALSDYERNLAGIGAHLAAYDSLADELYERLRARSAYYYYLQRSDELRNLGHVAWRLWIDYGREQHERLQQSSYCHVVERNPPSYSGRVDCVDIARCTVWEIKSETHDPSSGQRQADGYANAINAWMEGQWRSNGPIEPASGSPRRGMAFDDDFLAHAVASRCLVEGNAFFEGEVLTYPRCRNDIDLLCTPQPD